MEAIEPCSVFDEVMSHFLHYVIATLPAVMTRKLNNWLS